MNINDPIGDLITRIRNGQRVRKAKVSSPYSRMREHLLSVLKEEGYIRTYCVTQDDKGHSQLDVELKYHEGMPVIQEIKRISTPGRRVYSGIGSIKPVYNNLGINIISTSKGVMSDVKARKLSVGGEVLCTVF
jgi:small subunit ribosomal protein S8